MHGFGVSLLKKQTREMRRQDWLILPAKIFMKFLFFSVATFRNAAHFMSPEEQGRNGN